MQVYMKNFALIYEVMVPVLLVIVGLGFSKVDFFVNSPQRVLSPSMYPLKQSIYFN